LRDKIADPLTSLFRTFTPADLDARMKALDAPANWRFSDAEIEASRQQGLAGRQDREDARAFAAERSSKDNGNRSYLRCGRCFEEIATRPERHGSIAIHPGSPSQRASQASTAG